MELMLVLILLPLFVAAVVLWLISRPDESTSVETLVTSLIGETETLNLLHHGFYHFD